MQQMFRYGLFVHFMVSSVPGCHHQQIFKLTRVQFIL